MGTDSEISALKKRLAALDRERAAVASMFAVARLFLIMRKCVSASEKAISYDRDRQGGPMADVFISYASENRATAVDLARAIESAGFSVWWDRRIEAGAIFTAEVERELLGAKAIIVAWSNAAIVSEWVRDEAAHGRDTNRLLPILIEGVLPPLGFRQRQAIDLTGWDGSDASPALARLIDSLRALLLRVNSSSDDARMAGATSLPLFEPLLAILPFDEQGGDESVKLLADGVAEEISLALARIRGLRVVSRISAFQFRGPRKTGAGNALNATHILDGTVKKIGNVMRVTTQLANVMTGAMIWTARYECEAFEILALQDRITNEVATALQYFLADRPPTFRVDPATYEKYLRGRQLARLQTEEANAQAIAYLGAAARAAPEHARSWAALAAAHADRLSFVDVDEHPEIAATVQDMAARALAVDPNIGQAYAARLSTIPDIGRWQEKQEILDAGLTSDPNDVFMLSRGALFRVSVGYLRAAILDYAIALRIDPLAPQAHLGYGISLWLGGRAREADAFLRKACEIWPEHVQLWFYRYWILLNSDFVDDAEHHLAAPRPGAIDDAFVQQQIRVVRAARDARGPGATEWINWMKSADPGLVARLAMQSGPLLARLGRFDDAFAVLESALRPPWRSQIWGPAPFRVRPGAITATLFSPASRDLRRDPRFAQLTVQIGLAAFWRDRQLWPDCAAEVAQHYDFKAQCERALAARL
jgi:adenylate cyclase